MILYCPECVVSWDPYMTVQGACVRCGGGTVRRNGTASDDAVELHKAALAERERLSLHEEFEAFYLAREVARSGLDSLPVTEPEEHP